MDMRFHWLRCLTNQKQFRTYWRAGATNLADYVTKHHAPIHHRTVRALYLTDPVKLARPHTKLHGSSYPIDHIKSPLPSIIPSAALHKQHNFTDTAPHGYHCKGVLYMPNLQYPNKVHV
eukprot:CCRYP_001812-RC/>CCRYP_001812-RC protein AED:0.73 eAED:0.43 QI:0/-1/0/1/-1/0/1/0/118